MKWLKSKIKERPMTIPEEKIMYQQIQVSNDPIDFNIDDSHSINSGILSGVTGGYSGGGAGGLYNSGGNSIGSPINYIKPMGMQEIDNLDEKFSQIIEAQNKRIEALEKKLENFLQNANYLLE